MANHIRIRARVTRHLVEREQLPPIEAVDSDGNPRLVQVYRDVRILRDLDGKTFRRPGLLDLFCDGSGVNYEPPGRYEVVQTGEVLTGPPLPSY